MKTEIGKIALRTSHRFWPWVVGVPVLFVLLVVALQAVVMPVPPEVDFPALERCTTNPLEPACERWLPAWFARLPTRDQLVEWKTAELAEVLRPFSSRDPDNDELNRLFAETIVKERVSVAWSHGDLQHLAEQRDWSAPVPESTAPARGVVRVAVLDRITGFESNVNTARVLLLESALQRERALQPKRAQLHRWNIGVYALTALSGLLAFLSFFLVFRLAPRAITLTPFELRIGRRRVRWQDVDEVDWDAHGGTFRTRRGRVRVPVEHPAHRMDLIAAVAEAREQSEDDPDGQQPQVDPALDALRGQAKGSAS